MNYLASIGILSIYSSFFGGLDDNIAKASLINDEAIIYQGETMKVIIPEYPLSGDSLKITLNSNKENFLDWERFNMIEAFEILQNIIRVWEEKDLPAYLIFGEEFASSGSKFGWEIVPFPKNEWSFWKQLKVLWNSTFRRASLSNIERYTKVKKFREDLNSFSTLETKQITAIQKISQENDAFCDQKVIEKQLVFQGKEVNVLYNYAPIGLGDEKLHFLIVPSNHRSKFSDLTESEYLESMQLSQRLVSFYKDKGYGTAYLFDKSGKEAGQTVLHWHQHLIFAATKTQDMFGKLTVLKNMLYESSPLSQEELLMRVQSLKLELNDVLRD